MSGSCTSEMKVCLTELEEIVATIKKLGGDSCTLYKEEGSGIGYILLCGVRVNVDGVKGELVVPITDVDKW